MTARKHIEHNRKQKYSHKQPQCAHLHVNTHINTGAERGTNVTHRILFIEQKHKNNGQTVLRTWVNNAQQEMQMNESDTKAI